MHNVLAVHKLQCSEELADNACSHGLSERAKTFKLLQKVASGDNLHDDEVVSLVLHKLIDASDVRMSCKDEMMNRIKRVGTFGPEVVSEITSCDGSKSLKSAQSWKS